MSDISKEHKYIHAYLLTYIHTHIPTCMHAHIHKLPDIQTYILTHILQFGMYTVSSCHEFRIAHTLLREDPAMSSI